MEKTKKSKSNILLWISVILIVILLIGSFISSWLSKGESESSTGILSELINQPLFLSAIGAILVFLLVERWKRIETEISNIRTNQYTILKGIREDAENIVKGRMNSTTRKAKAIESKIGGLIEEHPWITSITENDLIPDSSSCKIIMKTCERLIQLKRHSLLYEYIYSWFHDDSKINSKLIGTADDFVNLAEFCERVLDDDYLGLLVIKIGVERASNRLQLYPDLLKRLVRNGNYNDSRKYAIYLKKILPLRFKFLKIPYFRVMGLSTDFIYRAYCSLVLFESLKRNKIRVNIYLDRASQISRKIEKEKDIICTQAEANVILGNYQFVEQTLDSLNIHESNDQSFNPVNEDYVFDAIRIYSIIGKEEKAIQISNNYSYNSKKVSKVSDDLNQKIKSQPKNNQTSPDKNEKKVGDINSIDTPMISDKINLEQSEKNKNSREQ